MMHFSAGDYKGAGRLFAQSLSMDPDNQQARLLLFIIEWLSDDSRENAHRRNLLALDWRSLAEFQGYLARVLEGSIDEKSAIESWDTAAEKSWLYYVVGLIRYKRGDWAESERLIREAVLAADNDTWELFLARAKLEQIQKQMRKSLKSKEQWAEYKADLEAFDQTVQKAVTAKKEHQSKATPVIAKLEDDSTSIKDTLEVLDEIHELNPDNRNLLVSLAFYSAMDEAWPQALKYARTFLEREGRQNSNRMSVGLLEPGILHYQGLDEKARITLEAYTRRTRDPWYTAISEYMLGKQTEESLKEKVWESPENLLTANTALGFWAEGSGDKEKAIRHYKEALESFLDTWLEYDFARERIKRLKRPKE
jgi:tetratricopeptide (TPR) repeat protein